MKSDWPIARKIKGRAFAVNYRFESGSTLSHRKSHDLHNQESASVPMAVPIAGCIGIVWVILVLILIITAHSRLRHSSLRLIPHATAELCASQAYSCLKNCFSWRFGGSRLSYQSTRFAARFGIANAGRCRSDQPMGGPDAQFSERYE